MKSIYKNQVFDYNLIAMAYHEAAHTVCALNNYLHVFDVNVMTLKRRGGSTEFYIYGNDDIKDEELNKISLILQLQTLYAGLIGEKMYYKDICGSLKFPMHLRIGSSCDIALASSIIRKNNLSTPGKKTSLFKKQIQLDVEQILSEHWDGVKVIAHSLYMKKKLTFEELKFLLTRKTEHKDFWKNRFRKIKLIHNDKNIPTEETAKELMLEDLIFNI